MGWWWRLEDDCVATLLRGGPPRPPSAAPKVTNPVNQPQELTNQAKVIGVDDSQILPAPIWSRRITVLDVLSNETQQNIKMLAELY